MEAVMLEVNDALSGMTDEQKAHYQSMIAGLNHGKSFVKMLQGLNDEYFDLKGEIKDSKGALEEMREEMMDNLLGALKELSSARSEEHTSELQSRGHLVCRLLLGKTNE